MKTTKIILAILVTLNFSSLVVAQTAITPGTGVANGAGGYQKPEGWIPVAPFGNWGKAKRTINLEDFSKRFPVALNFCREQKDVFFPPMPADLGAKIVFQNSSGENLNIKDICSSERLLKVYIPFVFSLYFLQENLVFKYLIESSLRADPRPIVVKLFKSRKSVKARGRKIEEESWFDVSDGSMGWGPMIEEDSLIGALLKRCESALILHELAHIWSYRILGGYQAVEYWHDARFKLEEFKEDSNGITVRSKSNFYEFETGSYQAFIEALSNLAELSLSLIHPVVDFNGVQSFYPDSRDPSGTLYHTYGGGRFVKTREQLLANEAFVSSVLSEFISTYEVEKGETNILTVGDSQRIINLMKAFEKTKATDLVVLMQTFDQMQNSDEGQKLVREFLLWDYSNQRDLSSDLTVRHVQPEFYRGGMVADPYTVIETNEKVPATTFFSPLSRVRRAEAYERLRKINAESLSRDVLLSMVKEFEATVREQDAKYKAVEPQLKSRMNGVSNIVHNYNDLAADHDPLALKLVEFIYDFSIHRENRLMSEMEIESILRNFSNSEAGLEHYKLEMTQRLSAVVALRARIENSLSLSTRSPDHLADLEVFQSLKGQSIEFFNALTVLEALEKINLQSTKDSTEK